MLFELGRHQQVPAGVGRHRQVPAGVRSVVEDSVNWMWDMRRNGKLGFDDREVEAQAEEAAGAAQGPRQRPCSNELQAASALAIQGAGGAPRLLPIAQAAKCPRAWRARWDRRSLAAWVLP